MIIVGPILKEAVELHVPVVHAPLVHSFFCEEPSKGVEVLIVGRVRLQCTCCICCTGVTSMHAPAVHSVFV